MDPRILLIAAAAAGLWYAGKGTAHGVKKAAHAVEHAIHRTKKPLAAPVGK